MVVYTLNTIVRSQISKLKYIRPQATYFTGLGRSTAMVGIPTPTNLGARQSQAKPVAMSFPPQEGFITQKYTIYQLSEWLVSNDPTDEEAGC